MGIFDILKTVFKTKDKSKTNEEHQIDKKQTENSKETINTPKKTSTLVYYEEKKVSPPGFRPDYSYTKARRLDDEVVILDFETTGFSPISNEIIQIGEIRMKNQEIIDKFERYVKPINPIPLEITDLTGITDEHVRDTKSLKSSLQDLLIFFGNTTIVAHNAKFDMKFLLANLQRQRISHHKFRAIDTLPLARKHIYDTENHKLMTLKEYLNIDVESYDAISDCIATGELYFHLKNIAEKNI